MANLLFVMLCTWLVCSQVSAFHDLTALQLSKLKELQYSEGCRDTYITKNSKRFKIPWFCVKSWQCTDRYSGDNPVPNSQQDYSFVHTQVGPPEKICDFRQYINGDDTCCFGPALTDFSNIPDWTQIGYESDYLYGKALDMYSDQISIEYLSRAEQDLFKRFDICAIKPKAGVKGFTLYAVWFCVRPSLCNDSREYYEPEPQNHNFCENNPLIENTVETILKGPQICCNVRGLELPELDIQHPQLIIHYKALPTYATFVPGFRSSLQCEMYSKLSCLGEFDMCAYRILNRDKEVPYPMEAYHQAMIGILKRRAQIFYCQGTLVSRFFILSALDCEEFDGTLANIATVGDYKLGKLNEDFSEEVVTYISEHHAQRHYRHYRASPPSNDREYYDKEIILFKVWRPILLSPYRRPACINYQIEYKYLEWMKEGSALFTGYGSLTPDGGLNPTVKRFLMQIVPTSDEYCNRVYPLLLTDEPQELYQRGVDFCTRRLNMTYREFYDETYGDGSKPWGPCFRDLGGPLVRLKSVPYCQFQVLGVLTLPLNTNCIGYTYSYRFRSVEPLRKWLEDTIYKDDFYLYDFDLSWPSCDRYNWQFLNATYIHRDYAQFARSRYEKL